MSIITSQMRENAEKFILNWRGVLDERSEAQSFTNEFFEIFGLYRKNYGKFEKPIKKKNANGTGFADFLWAGKLIIEAKSANKDNPKHWEETLLQAKDYIENLTPILRPQIILLMNFKRFQIHKVEAVGKKIKIQFFKEILIEDLAKNLNDFSFFLEFANQLEEFEEKVNQEAAQLIANLHENLKGKGYNAEDTSIFLARILFCLFAEDTGIFDEKLFENYLREQTIGKTLGGHLKSIFDVINTDYSKRSEFNKELLKFPYVNGGLFKKELNQIPVSDDAFRDALIHCCAYDWAFISPVIFGSLFQAIMEGKDRRSFGAHFTSEKNILRAINPLFLDKLHEDFEKSKNNKIGLEKFRKKLSELIFLDPACGCGNFLVVTYRELRMLDIEIIRKQQKKQRVTDINLLINILLTNFYGYEIDKTSAIIAEVAMWLTEHQCNMKLNDEFGTSVPTIPLKDSAQILNCNSLQIEWKTNIDNKYFDFILGNPPFIGKQYQSLEQKKDLEKVFKGISGAGVLDYVACWYVKAAEYMKKNNQTQTALVSTNSISQGEQTGLLWNLLFNTYKVKINFAHQTFKWFNEAQGLAAVHCVIIGFGIENFKDKSLFEYSDIKGEPIRKIVKNINPYLVEGNDITILKRRQPICSVPEISFGSMPNDGGHLLLDDDEKDELLKKEPDAKKWIRPLISAHEYLNGKTRWCLWLPEIKPEELKNLKLVNKRVQEVKKHRTKSNRDATNKLASTPYLFGEIRQPENDYIFIPLTSSENRHYIPIDFIKKGNIANNSCSLIPNATLFHFGVLTSTMHMTWVRYVCGRLKSDYRYSNEIVYNNFPFPIDVSKKNITEVEKAAKIVIEIRETFTKKSITLADLYNPNLMPDELSKAHQVLDKAVDRCYRDTEFISELKRIEFLFELYEKYTANLFTVSKKKKNINLSLF